MELLNDFENNDILRDVDSVRSRPEDMFKTDMDHVHITFTQYLFGMFFIAPNAMYLWLTGMLSHTLRKYAIDLGILKKKPMDPLVIVRKLLTEGSMSTYLLKVDDKHVGLWEWHDFDYLSVELEGRVRRCDTLRVMYNLETNELVSARLDGYPHELSAKDLICVLWFDWVTATHVKIHATANWGIDPEHDNSFLRRMGVTTVMYNHFGFNSFVRIMKTLHSWGLAQHSFEHSLTCFANSAEKGMHCHRMAANYLAKTSEYVKFLMAMRIYYLKKVREYGEDFETVWPEANYIGTVMHSLDHSQMAYIMEDALWLTPDNKEFAIVAELGQIIRVGFVEDIPMLFFSRKCRNSPHEFYRKLYQFGMKINPRLAREMDTAIIK